MKLGAGFHINEFSKLGEFQPTNQPTKCNMSVTLQFYGVIYVNINI